MMIKASQFVMLVLVVVAVACASYALATPLVSNELPSGGTQMNTNIALVGSEQALNQTYRGLAVVDPIGALNGYATQDQDDIEEDPNDRFITSKKGLLRPILVNSPQSEWAEEVPVAKFRKADHEPEVLLRKKRCNNNDDDGDARRARRARRTRRTRAKRAKRRQAKAARRAAKSTSTTVTRTVIQNGQVVSTTSETQAAVKTLPANQVLVSGGQPLTTTVVQTVPQQQQQRIVVQQPAVVTATAPQVAIQ